jgi:hypothetical protein
MGQHKTNLTAQAAARGEISKADRVRVVSVGSRFGGPVEDSRYIRRRDGSMRRKFPKVRGKANVKCAKKARRLARKWAAAQKAA